MYYLKKYRQYCYTVLPYCIKNKYILKSKAKYQIHYIIKYHN